ncbi:hypothetical protein OSB04_019432 [Centaurea solstitialis]|uniref:Uncharacterized protein n=1 Tax=Centaurea solstitialis TaxID=347529 RepID=A0AA38WE91_9ASTR|nr:hypothetical protein OSB04_019432 [Centaurea solstitialis]
MKGKDLYIRVRFRGAQKLGLTRIGSGPEPNRFFLAQAKTGSGKNRVGSEPKKPYPVEPVPGPEPGPENRSSEPGLVRPEPGMPEPIFWRTGFGFFRPNLEEPATNCGFVRWLDKPMCPRSMQVIPGLLRSKNLFEAKLSDKIIEAHSFFEFPIEYRHRSRSGREKKPKLSSLRIWGCEMYVKRYPKRTLGYYFENPNENKVFVARNGTFIEENFLNFKSTRNDELQTQDLHRSNLVLHEPNRYLGFLITKDDGDFNEPTSYGDIVSGKEYEQ